MPGALDQQALGGILKARERHLKTMAHLGEVEDKITPDIGAGYRDALDYGRHFERALVRIDKAQQEAIRSGVGTQLSIDDALDHAADQAEIDPEESAENAREFLGDGDAGETMDLMVEPESGAAYLIRAQAGEPVVAAGPVPKEALAKLAPPADAGESWDPAAALIADGYVPKWGEKATQAVTGALDSLVPWAPPGPEETGEAEA
jgi:hypothetical protein